MQHLHIEHNDGHTYELQQAAVRTAIIRTLVYFDIFHYPLTLSEIIRFSSLRVEAMSAYEHALNKLVESFMVFRFGDFYSLQNEPLFEERRKKGNAYAADVLQKAAKRSRFIHAFPFVRSVNISGSLSKNYFDDTTDFDFFIITQKNRIWLCRFFLTLYKKIFLLNSRKYFCINYYIDTDELQIPDKNLFSATEIITLRNETGENVYRKFMEENAWAGEYFPNNTVNYSYVKAEKNGAIKRTLEKIFGGRMGDKCDDFIFSIMSRALNKKYKHLKTEERSVSMRTKKHASKHHPQGFQFKVLKAFDEKCKDFRALHNLEV